LPSVWWLWHRRIALDEWAPFAFLQRYDIAAGIGVGLVLQAAFTLALDIFAEARGTDYLSAIHEIPI